MATRLDFIKSSATTPTSHPAEPAGRMGRSFVTKIILKIRASGNRNHVHRENASDTGAATILATTFSATSVASGSNSFPLLLRRWRARELSGRRNLHQCNDLRLDFPSGQKFLLHSPSIYIQKNICDEQRARSKGHGVRGLGLALDSPLSAGTDARPIFDKLAVKRSLQLLAISFWPEHRVVYSWRSWRFV
jgi:hypothetical protein